MSNPIKPVVVTVTDDKLESIHQVAELLAAKGFQVDEVFPLTGVIVGNSSLEQIPVLKQIDGVMGCEEEATTQLS